jgi:2-phosphosulfolactate phosphatase
VVDILRATSCMVTALAQGVQRIRPYADLEACRAMKADGYFTAGERNGEKVEGFDFGNSPFEYMDEKLVGERIAFTTTNGTQAIAKSQGAKEIIIGAFLNLTAVTEYLKHRNESVLVVCAAWKGKVNLEDTLFAGALVENLKDHIEPDCDAPLAAQRLYNLAKKDMVDFLKDSSHVKRLNRLNIHKDIEFCLTPDQYNVIPKLISEELVLA